MSVIMEIRRKNWPLAPAIFKVTEGYWDWHASIHYLWLSIKWSILTMGLSPTVSKINANFGRKSHSSTIHVFSALADEVSLGIL